MTRFFATKNCTASRLNAQSSFLYLPAVLVRFLNLNYSCFLGDKSYALQLDEKQHGGTKQ